MRISSLPILGLLMIFCHDSYAQEIACKLSPELLRLYPKVYPISGGGTSYYKIFGQQKQEGLVDSTGKVVLDPSYKYIGNISGNFLTVKLSNGSYQLMNISSGEKIALPYEAVSPDIQDGTITVRKDKGPQLIDLQNNILIPEGMFTSHSDAAEGLIPVQQGTLYGYADYHGKIVVPPKYYYADGFFNGLGLVYSANGDSQLEGLVNRAGHEVLPPVYRKILYVDVNMSVEDTTGKTALFKRDGTQITPFIYDNIYDQTNDHYVVGTRDHADFLLDTNGRETFKSEYLQLNNDGGPSGLIKNSFVIASNYNSDGILKYGLIKYDGTVVLPLFYDFLDGFGDEELIMLPPGTEKYGTIDYQGREVLKPQYDEILMKTASGYVVRLEDKIGVIDKSGKILIPFKYDSLADDRPLCLISLRTGDTVDYYNQNLVKIP